MDMKRQAFFVNKPRVLTDLMIPHHPDDERDFLISKRIELLPIDYENFVTDLRVNRDYIENSSNSCDKQNEIFNCLLISEIGGTDGVLVIPSENGFIKKAAFLEE